MSDCLLEILQEVQLERYYKGFVDGGLGTCEALVNLSMQEYSRYGVASMQDRLRLFKLIQIVKSVQDEGIVCRHKTQPKSTQTQNQSKTPDSVDKSSSAKPPKAPVSKFSGPSISALGETKSKKDQEKNRWDENQFFAHRDAQCAKKPEKTEVVYKKGSDTPIFKCRKTLNFSLESDSSSDDAVVSNGGTNNGASHDREDLAKLGNAVDGKASMDQAATYKVQFHTRDQPQSFVVDTGGSSSTILRNTSSHKHIPALSGHETVKATSFPVTSTTANTMAATVVTKGTAVDSSKSSASTGSLSQPTFPANTPPPSTHTVPIPRAAFFFEPLHTVEPTKEDPENKHAYFPTFKPSPVKEPHVERIYHNLGYDYGVPKSSPAGKVELKRMSSVSDRIRVCVRKRPLTVRETKRSETDVVKVPASSMVIVEENRVAVDLMKYIQEVEDKALPSENWCQTLFKSCSDTTRKCQKMRAKGF